MDVFNVMPFQKRCGCYFHDCLKCCVHVHLIDICSLSKVQYRSHSSESSVLILYGVPDVALVLLMQIQVRNID